MALTRSQLFRILKEHYVQGMTQREIAKQEELSTATISRAIKEGIDKGYVTITLHIPEDSDPYLEKEIKERYGLSMVYVARVSIDDPDVIMQDVASVFADYMDTLIKSGDIIGLSWGRTMAAMAKHLRRKEVENVTFVSINGGVSGDVGDTSVEHILRQFSAPYNAKAFSLTLPTFVANNQLAEELKRDDRIGMIYDQILKANIAIFSLGGMTETSLLYQTRYFDQNDYNAIIKKGYVGEIASNFYKADGSYDESDLKVKSMGIPLEALRKKQRKICIVTHEDKAAALRGALEGHYIDELFIDEKTARALLGYEK